MSQESLELDILIWIAENSADESIRAQCRAVKVVSREHTGAGSYSQLKTSNADSPSSLRVADVDPAIESPELPFGGGAVLTLKDGFVDLLEIYVNGDVNYPEDIGSYELVLR